MVETALRRINAILVIIKLSNSTILIDIRQNIAKLTEDVNMENIAHLLILIKRLLFLLNFIKCF